MNFPRLLVRNVVRTPLRTTLTILGVGIAVLTFVLLRTVVYAWTANVDAAAADRITTRHRVTFIMTLPKRYIEEVRNIPGVSSATWVNWFGGKDPKHDKEFFASVAVDTQSYFQVYDERVVQAADLERWKQDRKGVIVGDAIAKKLGWKVGDRLMLRGSIYPGDWEFNISGIYSATRKSVDRSTVVMHWDYMNDTVPERRRNEIGWIVSRVGKSAGTNVGRAIDKVFSEREVQTLSMSEEAFNRSYLGRLSAVLHALNVVSVVILSIMLLILGNTIAMGVRERTNEYGVLRAIGFLPKHLAFLVLGEAFLVGLLGGGVGLSLSYPIVHRGLGGFIEENMGAMFPYFRVPVSTAVTALGIAIGLALLAAALPAYRVAKLEVISALRRLD